MTAKKAKTNEKSITFLKLTRVWPGHPYRPPHHPQNWDPAIPEQEAVKEECLVNVINIQEISDNKPSKYNPSNSIVSVRDGDGVYAVETKEALLKKLGARVL